MSGCLIVAMDRVRFWDCVGGRYTTKGYGVRARAIRKELKKQKRKWTEIHFNPGQHPCFGSLEMTQFTWE